MKIPKWIKVTISLIVVLFVLIIATSVFSLWSINRANKLLETKAKSGPVEWGPISIKGLVGTLETNYSGSTKKATFRLRLNENPPPKSEFSVGIGAGEQLAAWVTINGNDFEKDGQHWVAEAQTKEFVSASKYARANKWALMTSDPHPEEKEGTRLTE